MQKILAVYLFFMTILLNNVYAEQVSLGVKANLLDSISTKLVVKSSPNKHAETIYRLSKNEFFEINSIIGKWSSIRLENGVEGFVLSKYLQTDTIAKAKVHIIDVGTGLSVFIKSSRLNFLYDAGSNDDPNNRTLAFIKKEYPDLSHIDILAISHPHKDHISYISELLDHYPIREIWYTGNYYDSCVFQKLLKKIEEKSILLTTLSEANKQLRYYTEKQCSNVSSEDGKIDIDNTASLIDNRVRSFGDHETLKIVYADARTKRNINNNSLVIKYTMGKASVLMTGDIQGGQRQSPDNAPAVNSPEYLLSLCCKKELTSSILISPHHGSMTSSRREFIDAVSPKYIAVSSGPKKYHGTQLPDKVILDMYEKMSINTISTSKNDNECMSDNPVGDKISADHRPGGCTNISFTLNSDGTINTK